MIIDTDLIHRQLKANLLDILENNDNIIRNYELEFKDTDLSDRYTLKIDVIKHNSYYPLMNPPNGSPMPTTLFNRINLLEGQIDELIKENKRLKDNYENTK